MDKQKQIEKMASDIGYAFTEKDLFPDDAKRIAVTLYLLGYRKIPENAVVILDEEMENFAEKLAQSPQMQKVMQGLIKSWQKETAEKYAKRLKEMHDYDERLCDIADEICKEITGEKE